jgi:tripartite-type tricarboxylate transporter receptor subunit TctC
MNLRIFKPLTITLLGLIASPALGQNVTNKWPDRPIRLVVPFPAGSATDSVARIVGQKLSSRLGQQFVVENRVGASGNIGSDMVAKASPDGYTMGLITASTHAVAPSLGELLPYDPIKDFKPISMIAAAPYALVIYAGIPVNNLNELVALAKSKPGALNYGSAGLASLAHLAGALFATQTGIDITHIPYRSTAQSSMDIITGRLDMQFATVAPTLANIRDGKLKALATTGRKRLFVLPDTPTMMESGVPDYEVSLWMAFAMPPNTPDEIVAKLNREMTVILNDRETISALQQQGFEPDPGPSEAVTAVIRSEIEKWRALVEKTGIKTK